MSDIRTMRPLDDDALAAALRDLSSAIDWPADGPAGPDLATRVAVVLRSAPTPAPAPWRRPAGPRRLGRGLALALIALLALAAVAGAMVFGLPGLRISFGEPSVAPPTPIASAPASGASGPTIPPGPPGAGLGLGESTSLADAAATVGRILALPSDPAVGPPDAVYVDPAKGDAVALVWGPSDDLPATLDPSIGLLVMSFEGTMTDGLYEKLLGSGARLQPVRVGTASGYWIEGTPHFFFFERADGGFVEDARRWVGDALVWSDGTTTWRLESALGRDATIQLAESLR